MKHIRAALAAAAVLASCHGAVAYAQGRTAVCDAVANTTCLKPSAANGVSAQVTVSSSSATLVVAQRTGRQSVTVENDDASINLFVGFTSSVTTTTGLLLKPGASATWNYSGPLYAEAASGSLIASSAELY